MEPYYYSPLPENHIRLLKVRRSDASDGEHWSISLRTFDLKSAPRFKALSYVWGPPSNEEQHRVSCNDAHDARIHDIKQVNTGWMQLTPNLHQALPQVWRLDGLMSGKQTPFWVDAICINQQDEEEKSRIIRQMYDYFDHAKEVLMWLGPAADESDRVLAFFRHVCVESERRGYSFACSNSTHTFGGCLGSDGIAWDTSPRYEVETPEAFEVFLSRLVQHTCTGDVQLLQDTKIPSGVQALFERDWFHRVWTFQEVELANQGQFICGSSSIDFVAFRCLAYLWFKNDFLLLDSPLQEAAGHILDKDPKTGPCTRLRAVNDWVNIVPDVDEKVDDWLPFWSYLEMLPSRDCALAEDRIYGVLALASKRIKAQIPIRYSQGAASANWLFVYVNKLHLEESMYKEEPGIHLHLLAMLDSAAGSRARPGLPTWAADWAQLQPARLEQRAFYNGNALRRIARYQFSKITISDGNVLELEAVEACRVSAVFTDWRDQQSFMCWINQRYSQHKAETTTDREHPIYAELNRVMMTLTDYYGLEEEGVDWLSFFCDPEKSSKFLNRHLRKLLTGLALVYLDDGSYAFASQLTQPEDIVVLICATQRAYILRPGFGQDHSGRDCAAFVGAFGCEQFRGDLAYLAKGRGEDDPDIAETVLDRLRLRTRVFRIK